VSEPKNRREIELLVDALDEEPEESERDDAVRRLGIDVKVWAAEIRTRVSSAAAAARQQRFAAARSAYESDLGRLAQRRVEPERSVEEQRRVLRGLLARAPAGAAAAVHFHKFEEATTEELAEMIRSLRHLLGEDDDE
jgi:hypothetical protein